MRIDICLPAYNEEVVLEKNTLLVYAFCQKNLVQLDWQLVLIINGSNDQSPELAKKLAQQYKQIKAVLFEQGGKGQAIKNYWLQSQADIVCFMDIDLVVDLEALPRLLEPIINQQADLVIGNRFNLNSIVRRSLIREVSSRLYNLVARLILKHQTKDLQCGFKAIKQTAFIKLADKITDAGWFFDTELILWSEKIGLKIKDIAVDWQENRQGKRSSKLNLVSNAIKFLKNLISLRKKLKRHSVL